MIGPIDDPDRVKGGEMANHLVIVIVVVVLFSSPEISGVGRHRSRRTRRRRRRWRRHALWVQKRLKYCPGHTKRLVGLTQLRLSRTPTLILKTSQMIFDKASHSILFSHLYCFILCTTFCHVFILFIFIFNCLKKILKLKDPAVNLKSPGHETELKLKAKN